MSDVFTNVCARNVQAASYLIMSTYFSIMHNIAPTCSLLLTRKLVCGSVVVIRTFRLRRLSIYRASQSSPKAPPDPPAGSPRASQSSPRAPPDPPQAPLGPPRASSGLDLGQGVFWDGLGEVVGSRLRRLSIRSAFLELVTEVADCYGCHRSGVILDCCSDPPFHARRGPG